MNDKQAAKVQNNLIDKLDNVDFVNTHLISGVLVVLPDNDFTITHANDGFFAMTGYTREELFSLHHNKGAFMLHPDDLKSAREKFSSALKNGIDKTFSIRAKLTHKTKGYAWTHFSGRLHITDKNDKLIYCFLDDISDYIDITERLQKEQMFSKAILSLTDDVYFDYDIAGAKLTYSENFAIRFSIPASFQNYPDSFFSQTSIVPKNHIKTFKRVITDSAKGLASGNNAEVCFLLPSGQPVWFSQFYAIIKNESGKPVRVIGKLVDITEQRRWITRLTKKAETDPLTQLFNKEETRVRITQCLPELKDGAQFALFIIDIDNFKSINDNLGHQFGDAVLTDTAAKLQGPFRDTDILGRIGGDEFAVFMRNIKNPAIVGEKAGELCAALRNVYSGENSDHKVSCSIGIALCPHHGKTFDELYHNADIALYESKRRGKDQATIYNTDIAAKTANTPIPFEETERFLSTYFSGDIFYSIFEMLYEAKNLHTTINMILRLVGNKFDVSRCYIFEIDDDNLHTSNTYEWCAEGVKPEISNLQKIPLTAMADFLSQYNSEGIFYSNDIDQLDENSVQTLKNQGIFSILHSAFFDGKKMRGFVGFDDCTKRRVWGGDEIASLSYIARILAIFLVKRKISDELFAAYGNYTQMLDNMSGYVYVVNPQNFETLYINNAVKALGIQKGEKCHEITCSSDSPCQNCPVKKISNTVTSAEAEIYSIRIGRWLKSSASKISWTGGKEAVLVCCTDIHKYKTTQK